MNRYMFKFCLIRNILQVPFVSDRAEDFSRKYIRPNTYLPTPTIIINAVNHAASQGRFVADHGRMLSEWGRRLATNVTPEGLIKDFPSMKRCPETFEAFHRKWRYLFAYVAAGAS
ncbi:hypothetical protein EDB86DRAFT_2943901 [Lactarius hatsudake]|nr:hypothetical protein EDB86DRAFT_2943901 [Lactarius hatsudake]